MFKLLDIPDEEEDEDEIDGLEEKSEGQGSNMGSGAAGTGEDGSQADEDADEEAAEEELDADLMPVAGWTAALEFLRDAWVLGSASKSMPVARAIDLDAVAAATAGDSDG